MHIDMLTEDDHFPGALAGLASDNDRGLNAENAPALTR